MLKLPILEFWGPWITILVCSTSREGYNHVSVFTYFGCFSFAKQDKTYFYIKAKEEQPKGQAVDRTPPQTTNGLKPSSC